MAGMVQIDFDPPPRILRQFGWIALVGFGLVAALAWTESLIFAFGLGAARPWVAGAAAGLGLLAACFSLVAPRANRPLYVGLALLTFPIGFVLSHVILAALFFGLFVPVALFFRVTGRDPMRRAWDREAESYWLPAHPPRPKERYFRQY